MNKNNIESYSFYYLKSHRWRREILFCRGQHRNSPAFGPRVKNELWKRKVDGATAL